MTDSTPDEQTVNLVAKSICLADCGDQNTTPVPDELMPRQWALAKETYRHRARAAIAALPDTKWQASDGDTRCQKCAAPNPVWHAPNDVWNRVVGGPDATDDPAGVLCPNCFTAMSDEMWVVMPGTALPDAKALEARIAELEAALDAPNRHAYKVGFAAARADALRGAQAIVASKARETDSANARFELGAAGLSILALIDKEPTP